MAYNDPLSGLRKITHSSNTDQGVVFGQGTVPTGLGNPILIVQWSGTAQGTLTIEAYNGATGAWSPGEVTDLTTAANALYFETFGAVVRLTTSGTASNFTCYAALVPRD